MTFGSRSVTELEDLDLREIRDALESANMPTLLLVLATLTGDDKWLHGAYEVGPEAGPGDNDSGGLSEEVQREVRDVLIDVLEDIRAGRRDPAPLPSPERINEMLGITLHTEVPAETGPLLAEELGIIDRWVEVPPSGPGLDVAIIGGGFSGIGAAVALGKAGVPYTIIEKNPSIGGTWYENSYPGCGVDTPSHLYSFSFARNPRWSHYFSKRAEVRAYLEDVAQEHDVTSHARLNQEVTRLVWDDDAQVWELTVRHTDGREEMLSARAVISAVGLLNRPSIPPIPGLDTFDGPCLHTARWQDGLDLADMNVAVIGTGASSMQIVTTIADIAAHVTVFQRDAEWAVPHPNHGRAVSPQLQKLFAEIPYFAAWYRVRQVWNSGDRLHGLVQIDPDWPHLDRSINKTNESHRKYLTNYIIGELGERTDLINKCVPSYPPYGKRPLLDHGWYRTIARDDVTLVTDAVAEVRRRTLVTTNGTDYEADILILATGFQALNMLAPMDIRGKAGVSLREAWGPDDARAYMGITIPDFPNLFVIWGPNSNAGHGGSHALSAELQIRFIAETLRGMAEHGLTSVECRQDVFDAYNEELDKALEKTVWTHPGMETYYRNSKGRVVYNMPWTNAQYWHMTRRPNLDEFHLRTDGARIESTAAQSH